MKPTVRASAEQWLAYHEFLQKKAAEAEATAALAHSVARAVARRFPRPRLKQCRNCKEWFTPPRGARRTQRFCTLSCSAQFRTNSLTWKAQQSRKIKEKNIPPEIMRERSRKIWANPELRASISAKRKILANKPEARARHAANTKKLWADPAFRARHAESSRAEFKKRWADPEYRKKMSEKVAQANRRRWADPEYKARVAKKISRARQARGKTVLPVSGHSL